MVETTYEAQLRQIAAFDDLLAYFQGQKSRWDGDVAAAQAAYNQLSSNLNGVVDNRLNFTATWDPDAVAPTNVRGGVFSDLALIFSTAPINAYVQISLMAGKTYAFTKVYPARTGQLISFIGNAQNRPIFEIHNAVTNNLNGPFWIRLGRFGKVLFSAVDFTFLEKTDPNLNWNPHNGFVSSFVTAAAIEVTLDQCSVTLLDGLCFALSYQQELVRIVSRSVTIDGPGPLLRVGTGTAIISHNATTLLNGATVHAGGTVGQNVLTN